ncbi:MAG: 1-phosphofructokinase family hexose kinase [Microbacteriaceae bacterium]
MTALSASVTARPIVTLTVNPALDVATSTEVVESEHKLRCGLTHLAPGGGGINVSRVVRRLGGHALAVYAVGGPTGEAYRRLIELEGVPSRAIAISGSTRENFTVDETSTGKQFRFVLEGPTLAPSEWQACLDAVDEATLEGGYVVASGSVPPGAPDDFYARVARSAKERGAHCIVDASGPALAHALNEGVYLVKPSRRELGEYLGRELVSLDDQVEAASAIIVAGAAEYVALTLGGDGAILASRSRVIRLAVPKVEVVSTVGAGDSFLGAFVLRISQGRTPEAAFRAGVAAGTATTLSMAMELCTRNNMERLETELARVEFT